MSRGGKILYHDGSKFGRLTLIRRVDEERTARGARKWQCKCDCGRLVVVSASNVISGITKSCGCLRKEACRARERTKCHPTHGRVMTYYRRNARLRGLDWMLTESEFTALISGKCFYCGAEPQKRFLGGKKFGRTIIFNGIDRKKNSDSYHSKNVVSCCARCNWAKNDMDSDQFLEWIDAVHSHQKGGLRVQ